MTLSEKKHFPGYMGKAEINEQMSSGRDKRGDEEI